MSVQEVTQKNLTNQITVFFTVLDITIGRSEIYTSSMPPSVSVRTPTEQFLRLPLSISSKNRRIEIVGGIYSIVSPVDV